MLLCDFLAALPPEAYYQTSHGPQQTAASPPSLVHAARYLGPPSQMIPPPPAGSYYMPPPPPPAFGYPSPSLVPARPYVPAPPLRQYIPPSPTPQMMTEPSPSMEVRSGTVYFNAETQQPELRVGGIYYGPAGQQQPTSAALPVKRPNSAIPIVNPQVCDLFGFENGSNLKSTALMLLVRKWELHLFSCCWLCGQVIAPPQAETKCLCNHSCMPA